MTHSQANGVNGATNGSPANGQFSPTALFHSHDHSSHGHSHHSGEADSLLEALTGGGSAGSRVTLLGLGANVCLTGIKGVAGWYLNSAVLMADAAHSLSDLLGDFVTLFCYIFSRRPPSKSYPYGYGKFETIGTTVVSIMFLAGGVAIGSHSYTLLGSSVPSLPFLSSSSDTAKSHSHSHHHHHSHEDLALDPNAAWFALLSIVVKELLYRVTARIASQENSPVLLANALHHRSDMYSSLVSLVAILAGWMIPGVPIDPIGGVLVGLLILHQGVSVLLSSFKELTDASVPPSVLQTLDNSLQPLRSSTSTTSSTSQSLPSSRILSKISSIHSVRAIQRGSLLFVDVTVDVKGSEKEGSDSGMSIEDGVRVEKAIWELLSGAGEHDHDDHEHQHAEGEHGEHGGVVTGLKELNVKWRIV